MVYPVKVDCQRLLAVERCVVLSGLMRHEDIKIANKNNGLYGSCGNASRLWPQFSARHVGNRYCFSRNRRKQTLAISEPFCQ